MKLSVLVPTTPDRANQFAGIYFKLLSQINVLKLNAPELGDVEVRFDDSKRFLEGGLSIGDKRNKLLHEANGEYVCFIDDDDDVAPNYIESILRALYGQEVDIVTFRALIKNDHYWAIIAMSLQNDVNEEVNPYGVIKRTPWHICPIKAEIAKTESFSNLNHNEDWDWVSRILPKISSEIHLDVILTQYNHSEKFSEADKIFNSK